MLSYWSMWRARGPKPVFFTFREREARRGLAIQFLAFSRSAHLPFGGCVEADLILAFKPAFWRMRSSWTLTAWLACLWAKFEVAGWWPPISF